MTLATLDNKNITDFTQQRLLSHMITPEQLDVTTAKIAARIKQQGDKPHTTVEQQLELLDQLQQFDFGRYFLQNQGLDGHWTHYMLTHPWHGRKTGKNNRGETLSNLENLLLNKCPSILATQQRFEIFLKENQKQIINNAKLACIPCGMMGELLYLNYADIDNIELVGIDYDPDTLVAAQKLAERQRLSPFIKLVQRDAWNLNLNNEFDLISSNGLNIYEPNQERLTALYKQFYLALKPDGKLVTSFTTPPPGLSDQCEWDMSKIDQTAALVQRIIIVDIVEAKLQCYQSSAQMHALLETVGFRDIQFIYDVAKAFPTVVAYK